MRLLQRRTRQRLGRFRCDDPDDGDGPDIAIWCPVCAAEEFGYRPDIAATYVRRWDPLPR